MFSTNRWERRENQKLGGFNGVLSWVLNGMLPLVLWDVFGSRCYTEMSGNPGGERTVRELWMTFLLASSTFFTNLQHDVDWGQVSQWFTGAVTQVEEQVAVGLSSLDQLLVSGHLGNTVFGNGVGSLQQAVNHVQRVLDQQVGQSYHIGNLPQVAREKPVQIANGISIASGDSSVPSSVVKSSSVIILKISIPTIQHTTGMEPKDAKIVLFSSRTTYGAALEKAGIPKQEIPNIVAETGGITVGNDVWIPLYALQSRADLANVLTHELTHVTFNQYGIGNALPTWINEGTAWTAGMSAEGQVNKNQEQLMFAAYNQDLQAAVDSGQLLPLTADEQQILGASYNVEWEDFLAVRQLMNTHGLQEYHSFLQHVKGAGASQSFQTSFHVSLKSFQNEFDAGLANGSF